MRANAVTSREAVTQTIEEFDRLGEKEFFKVYGVGRSRWYFLKREGNLYDNSAILQVAYRKQFPDRPPLNRTQFSGKRGMHMSKTLDLDVVESKPQSST